MNNKSTRANISFEMIGRGFGFYQFLICLLLMCAAIYIGISQSTPATAGLFGVIIINLFDFSDLYQIFLR
jgi:hypothetical protein